MASPGSVGPQLWTRCRVCSTQGPSTCDVVGEPDIYGRVLGRCTVNGQNLNEQLVERGFAVARPSDTTDYVAAEAAAKEKKVGLWRANSPSRVPSAERLASGSIVLEF